MATKVYTEEEIKELASKIDSGIMELQRQDIQDIEDAKRKRAFIDLTGQQFGEWTVLGFAGNRYWWCRCSCNSIQKVHAYKLTSGMSQSCGHARNKFIDLTGQQFGEWAVVAYAGNHKWRCKCTCGKEGIVASKALRDGKSKSCGHDTTGFKDIKGKTFGDWTALEYLGETVWHCVCSCGTERNVKLYDLLHGRSTSCGHDTTGFKDLTGQQFGEWTVLRYAGNQLWECQCSCEDKTIRLLDSQALRTGVTRSCGCKTRKFMQNTSLERYRVKYSAQKHRAPEQVNMTSSKENLREAILSNFTVKPTSMQLSKLVGLQLHRTLIYVHTYGLEYMIKTRPKTSSYEDEINELFPSEDRNNRSVLSGQELDLYYPEHNFAIEFNGTYWHSDIYKHPLYHQNKSLEAIEAGIHIFHIFEYEWNNTNTREKLIKLISKKLGSEGLNRVYGRNCIVQTIDLNETYQFLEKYHLQGSAVSSVNLGLYSNDELIGVMTFGTPRFTGDYEYELIRLAWKDDTIVVGGAEKLFQHFIKNYNPNSIISYCDFSKFSGEVYKRLGFEFSGITSPNYKWVNIEDNTVLPRYQTTKQKLLSLGFGDLGNTETEIMNNLGFLKVYDSGNLRFTWETKMKHGELDASK